MAMVSVNVSQLLLAGLGTVRELDFSETLADPSGELHLRGPISGHARLTRTPEGILVHSEHAGVVVLEQSWDAQPPACVGALPLSKTRRHGRTRVSVYALDAPAD